jgi:hypothetical protein
VAASVVLSRSRVGGKPSQSGKNALPAGCRAVAVPIILIFKLGWKGFDDGLLLAGSTDDDFAPPSRLPIQGYSQPSMTSA